MFTPEELEKQLAETRKKKTHRQQRPDEKLAGKELAKIVAKKTGYQIKPTTEIIEAYHDVIFEALQNKVQVTIPKVGSIVPKIAPARRGMNFNRGKGIPPEPIIMQPKFCIEFIVNKNMIQVMRGLPISHEEIDNIYID